MVLGKSHRNVLLHDIDTFTMHVDFVGLRGILLCACLSIAMADIIFVRFSNRNMDDLKMKVNREAFNRTTIGEALGALDEVELSDVIKLRYTITMYLHSMMFS